ncbi:MAG TPA: hypothetical protein VGF67_05140 [Ktedonobacteraceae bacterium]|jgi:hypothetical protein
MRKRSTLVAIIAAIFTVTAAIVINLGTSFITTGIPLSITYGILIAFTVLTLVLALFQWLFPISPIKRGDTSEPKIEFLPKHNLAPDVVLKEQIKEEVKDVVREVEKAQAYIVEQPGLEISRDVLSNIDQILHTSSINPQATLLLLSAEIERQMGLRLQEAGLQPDTNYVSPRQAIDLAMKADLLPKDTLSAFRDFFAVRNKVAHNAAFDVDESTILALVSIGIELLKLVGAKKKQDTESSTIDVNAGK